MPSIILNADDDQTIITRDDEESSLALSTVRGAMYAEESKTNQDTVASFSAKTPFGPVLVDMVCDGLGGYADQNGELASRFCCEEAEKIIQAGFGASSREGLPQDFLRELLKKTVEWYKKESLGPNAGTTLLVTLTMGAQIFTYHLGDSRAMFFNPNGAFIAETKDHKPPEPEQRFRLTKYVYQTDPNELFSQADQLRIDGNKYPEGFVAVLMSDGITDNLKTSAYQPECQTLLSQLIREHRDAKSLCEVIMKTANQRMDLSGSKKGKELDVKPDNSACLVRWYK